MFFYGKTNLNISQHFSLTLGGRPALLINGYNRKAQGH